MKLYFTLVPKLLLGNPVSKAPALRDGKLELPTLNSQAPAWELALKKKEHLWAKIKKRFEKSLAKDDDTVL